jgi:hypothetical protein
MYKIFLDNVTIFVFFLLVQYSEWSFLFQGDVAKHLRICLQFLFKTFSVHGVFKLWWLEKYKIVECGMCLDVDMSSHFFRFKLSS